MRFLIYAGEDIRVYYRGLGNLGPMDRIVAEIPAQFLVLRFKPLTLEEDAVGF